MTTPKTEIYFATRKRASAHVYITKGKGKVRKLLYERVGFQAWGSEPAALRHEGRTVVEHHMALCFD